MCFEQVGKPYYRVVKRLADRRESGERNAGEAKRPPRPAAENGKDGGGRK